MAATKTKKAPTAGEQLSAWCTAPDDDLDRILTLLATGDDSVDAFLGGPAAELSFAARLLGEHVFEIGIALEDAPAIPGARWLALAHLDAHSFAWNLEAETVLPLDDAEASAGLEALLLSTLSNREDRKVLLGWLSHPAFLGEADAIDRIESALAGAGAALTWDDRLDTVRILARRGGRWEAARALEQLLRRSEPDTAEARAIHRRALTFVDATLLGVLGGIEPWASDHELLRELAEGVSTDELIEAFAPESGERRARREGTAPGPSYRAAWMELAARPENAATDTIGRLVVRCSAHLNDDALAGALAATLAAERGEHAVDALVAAFLAGLHRRSPGITIERILREHPERALKAALDLQPEWVHTFEPDAMARLAFRVLPRLAPEARGRIADEAKLQGGQRGLILLDELDAL
ncbi:MAG: hypothetical protein KDA24_25745 [Deltaproteobacteria bacterium]|nr:hypothetical protein [Deltaproteobacteria bacterium]